MALSRFEPVFDVVYPGGGGGSLAASLSGYVRAFFCLPLF